MSQGTAKKAHQTAWYVSRRGDGGNGEASGPFATDLVLAMLRDGALQPLDLVFREGETEWRPASTYRELKAYRDAGSGAAAKSENESGRNHTAPPATENPMPAMPMSSATSTAAGGRTVSWIVLRPHNSTYLQEGPFETQVIIDGLQRGRFQFSQYAWHVGMNNWMRIGDLREFDRRSRSRDSKPHVPPPLPDPIAAVLLEDDKDAGAEEFHVMMRGMSKHDLTPNPLDAMQALNVTQLGSVGIGGAAAESPEEKTAQQKAGHAMSLVVSPNLAGVPWEQEPSDGYAQSVELIDDEHSGVRIEPAFADDESIGSRSSPGLPNGEVSGVFDVPSADVQELTALEKTPLPFVPSAPMPIVRDAWDKWGRYAAGAAMGVTVLIFSVHLITAPKTSGLKTAAQLKGHEEASEIKSAKSSKSAVKPLVGSMEMDAPDMNPSSRTMASRPMPQAPTTPVATEVGVVGLKLDRPDGQVLIQGSLPQDAPIRVTFKGRLGQILSKLSVRKTIEIKRRDGEIPTLRLKDLKLPPGSYTVEVEAGGAKAKNEIFIGTRDGKFLDRLETHLRENALETQAQKKALFYTAQELDILARDLGQNYGQLRSKPETWGTFFTKWNAKVASLARSLNEIEKKKIDDQAYPEETASLVQAFTSLKNLASQYQQAVGQKRDIASDALTELIAEVARQKEAIGSSTARPTADTPDGML